MAIRFGGGSTTTGSGARIQLYYIRPTTCCTSIYCVPLEGVEPTSSTTATGLEVRTGTEALFSFVS